MNESDKKYHLYPAAVERLNFKVHYSNPGPELLWCGGDIEELLVEVCDKALEDVFLHNLLASWFDKHANSISADKVLEYSKEYKSRTGKKLFWLCVMANMASNKDLRDWDKVARFLKKDAKSEQPPLLKEVAKLSGNYQWLKNTGIYVPERSLRVRHSDV